MPVFNRLNWWQTYSKNVILRQKLTIMGFASMTTLSRSELVIMQAARPPYGKMAFF